MNNYSDPHGQAAQQATMAGIEVGRELVSKINPSAPWCFSSVKLTFSPLKIGKRAPTSETTTSQVQKSSILCSVVLSSFFWLVAMAPGLRSRRGLPDGGWTYSREVAVRVTQEGCMDGETPGPLRHVILPLEYSQECCMRVREIHRFWFVLKKTMPVGDDDGLFWREFWLFYQGHQWMQRESGPVWRCINRCWLVAVMQKQQYHSGMMASYDVSSDACT